jgi:hypothetical protein
MDIPTGLRLLLVYAHLMLCVFALHEVLVGDWRLLRGRVRAEDLAWTHRALCWLLAGLWLTGLGTGGDPARLAEFPKTGAKLVTTVVLTLNGVLLWRWGLSRALQLQALRRRERAAVLAAGATSTAGWLAAAFLGVAKPLKDLPATLLLQGVAVVLLAGLAVALVLAFWQTPAPADDAAAPSLSDPQAPDGTQTPPRPA